MRSLPHPPAHSRSSDRRRGRVLRFPVIREQAQGGRAWWGGAVWPYWCTRTCTHTPRLPVLGGYESQREGQQRYGFQKTAVWWKETNFKLKEGVKVIFWGEKRAQSNKRAQIRAHRLSRAWRRDEGWMRQRERDVYVVNVRALGGRHPRGVSGSGRWEPGLAGTAGSCSERGRATLTGDPPQADEASFSRRKCCRKLHSWVFRTRPPPRNPGSTHQRLHFLTGISWGGGLTMRSRKTQTKWKQHICYSCLLSLSHRKRS